MLRRIMKAKIIVYFLFILVFGKNAFSQKEYMSDVQREKIILAQLGSHSEDVCEKLLDDIKKADDLTSTADGYYKQLGKSRLELVDIKDKRKREKILRKASKIEKKALESRVHSLDHYHEVTVQKYQLFKNDLRKFMKTAAKLKVDSASIYEKQAYDSFEAAEIKVQIAYHTINYGDLFDIYTEAYKLEQIGILFQNKMYAIFLGWGNANIIRIDEEILAMQENRPVDFKLKENMSGVNITDSIVYEKVLVYDTIMVNKKMPELIYKVQIAASKTPLGVAQLKQLYREEGIINTVIEGDWYKYSVGVFGSYHEAKRFKINIGVSDAFIVAYMRGEKIQISDAVKNNAE